MEICNLDYLLEKYPYLGRTIHQSYQLGSLSLLIDHITSLRDLDVLEIGGALPPEIVIDQLSANSWTCVEKMDYWNIHNSSASKSRLDLVKSNISNPSWNHINACIFDWLDGLENTYDIIFSCCAFEHIGNIDQLLSNCYRSLRKGGTLFSYFLPVYSASGGHHCPDFYSRGELVQSASELAPFCHLLYSPSELKSYLNSLYAKDVAEYFHHAITSDPHINRMMYEDYIALIDKSMFSTKIVSGLYPVTVSNKLLTVLNARRGPYSYHYTGMCMALKK